MDYDDDIELLLYPIEEEEEEFQDGEPQPGTTKDKVVDKDEIPKYVKELAVKTSASVAAIVHKTRGQLLQLERFLSPTNMNNKDINDMTPLHLQRPRVPDIQAKLTISMRDCIERWAMDAMDVLPEVATELYISPALTTSHLLAQNGRNIDKIEIIGRYRIPPGTPTRGYPSVGRNPRADIEPYELEEEHPVPRRKNLVKHFGNKGSHNRDLSGSHFQVNTNLSDYYGEPLIEETSDIKTRWPDLEHRYENGSMTNRALDLVFCEDDEPKFLPARENYRPIEGIILYLRGKGMSFNEISYKLLPLDPHFIFEVKYHNSLGIRFKHHYQITEQDLEVYLKVAEKKSCMDPWDDCRQKDRFGQPISRAFMLFRIRQRLGEIRELVVKVVENHLWFRMTHHVCHPEIIPKFQAMGN